MQHAILCVWRAQCSKSVKIVPFIDSDTHTQTSSQSEVNFKRATLGNVHLRHIMRLSLTRSSAACCWSTNIFCWVFFSYISVITERIIYTWNISATAIQAANQPCHALVCHLVSLTPLNAQEQTRLFIHSFHFGWHGPRLAEEIGDKRVKDDVLGLDGRWLTAKSSFTHYHIKHEKYCVCILAQGFLLLLEPR